MSPVAAADREKASPPVDSNAEDDGGVQQRDEEKLKEEGAKRSEDVETEVIVFLKTIWAISLQDIFFS